MRRVVSFAPVRFFSVPHKIQLFQIFLWDSLSKKIRWYKLLRVSLSVVHSEILFITKISLAKNRKKSFNKFKGKTSNIQNVILLTFNISRQVSAIKIHKQISSRYLMRVLKIFCLMVTLTPKSSIRQEVKYHFLTLRFLILPKKSIERDQLAMIITVIYCQTKKTTFIKIRGVTTHLHQVASMIINRIYKPCLPPLLNNNMHNRKKRMFMKNSQINTKIAQFNR